jgi:hypothetical protein
MSRWLRERVFLYTMRGRVDEESVRALLEQGQAAIASGTCDYVVIDTTSVEGYSLKELIGVAPNQLVRTFAATMSFAVRLKLPLFETLAAADGYIRDLTKPS